MVDDVAATFLRHGLTKENERKRYVGWSDVPLSDSGIERLKELALLSYPKADLIVSSDLVRCRQTYEFLFSEMTVPVFTMKEWRELNFGDWEGKTYDELKEVKEYQEWLKSPFSVVPPNGESFLQFQTRIEKGLSHMLYLLEKWAARRVIVVTHGGPIRYILQRYAPVNRSFWEWNVPFGEGFTFYTTLDRWKERKRCTLLSEVPFKESENGQNNIMS